MRVEQAGMEVTEAGLVPRGQQELLCLTQLLYKVLLRAPVAEVEVKMGAILMAHQVEPLVQQELTRLQT